MDCPWRQTLASVFLLLSPHNLRVLSQNVGPTGPLSPPPLLNEPWIDYNSLGPGPTPQQMDLLPGLQSGILPEFVPLPYAPEYQEISEDIGPGYPQAPPFNPQVGQFQQGPFNPQINNLSPQQGPLNNVPLNTNVPPPEGLSLNIFPTPLILVPLGSSFDVPSSTNISPVPTTNILPSPIPVPEGPAFNVPPPNILPTPLVPIPQSQAFNVPPSYHFPFPQALPTNISPLVPVSQGQILASPPLPLTQVTGPACNVPPALPNQNMQVFPLVASSYPQPYFSPANAPCITTDLTSIHFLPPPNLSPSIPVHNHAPCPQTPVQPVTYPHSIVPVERLPNALDFSNFHVSALPSVFPANIPQIYDHSCGNFRSVAEEHNPMPINLNVNVPCPTIPEPKITIITAYPAPPLPPVVPISAADSSDVSLELFPQYPLPPIIIEGRKTRSRSWLPLFLVALFDHDGFHDGGGCCCCCSCNSRCSDTPIPYPIAIPTNNPIILGNSCRSRRRGTKARCSDNKNDCK